MAVLGLYEPFTHERTIVIWCVSGDGVAMLSPLWGRHRNGHSGPCTDLNGWFNLNLATVTRLLAGIKLWTLFVVYIVKCFCMHCCSPSGTFPLACTLLYGAGMPIHLHSAPHFKVGVQCTGAVVIYIIEFFGDNKWSGKMLFVKNHFALFEAFEYCSGSLNYSLYLPVD